MNFVNPEHPFYRPLWRRVLIVALCLVWALVEQFGRGATVWAIIFAAAGAYCAWTLLWAYDPPPVEDDKT